METMARHIQSSLVSRKWLDTWSVIPAKAGIQLTLLWIPAYEFVNLFGLDRLEDLVL